MSGFKYELSVRVLVPGEENIQGVISSRREFIRGENEYDVHYMLPDLSIAHLVCSESSINEAQSRKTCEPEIVICNHCPEEIEVIREVGIADRVIVTARKITRVGRNRKRR